MGIPASAERDSGRAIWFAGAVLVAATVAAYANSCGGPFVFDDVQAIAENPSLRHLWPLGDALGLHAEGGLTASGRPLLHFSFALNYAVSGTAVWSYHALNLAIHAAAGLLLFGLVRRTLAARGNPSALPLAFASAALWLLHPLQTEAVTYIVQRAESLVGFFCLLSLYAFARGWFATCVAAALAGVATKEVAVTLPLLVLLYDRTFVAGSFAAAWRARRGVYLFLGATWLVLAALIVGGGSRGGTMNFGSLAAWPAYWATQGQAIVRYLSLAAWPHPLVFDYGTFWAQRISNWLPQTFLVLALVAASGIALWKRPAAGFCGAWFFLILAPTSLSPGRIQMIVEHRVYLPLAGMIVLGVVALESRAGRKAIAAALLAALACGVLTLRRNQDYRTELGLWRDTIAKRPDNALAHRNLAEALARAGRFDAALPHAELAARLRPDDAVYQYNLGHALADVDRIPEAIRAYENATRLNPAEASTHNNLAAVLARAGRFAEALEHAATAARLRPNDAGFRFNHGAALERADRIESAVAEYEAAVRLRGDYAEARFKLGNALVKLDRAADAVPQYQVAIRLRPDDAEAHHNLGIAYARLGRFAEAKAEFETAVRLQPDYPEARRHLEQMRALGK